MSIFIWCGIAIYYLIGVFLMKSFVDAKGREEWSLLDVIALFFNIQTLILMTLWLPIAIFFCLAWVFTHKWL